MATLVLSSFGTALGGPIGGAIGSLIGQGIDRQLLGPGPRQGPRLGDLSVQTSSYGSQLPRIYGTMRVAGVVVWATELKESSRLQGAKGQPETVMYSYSANFAVALSSRPARRVKRIWADGKLLRGAAGDFKVKTGFRFYPGSEDQPIDPLIASVEGIERTPAFRGIALAVFEKLELAEFGNRIPFLSFEIEADDADPSVGFVLADASGGVIDAQAGETIRGYAAYGRSSRAAIEPLVDQFGLALSDDGERISTQVAAPAEVTDEELGAGAGTRPGPGAERSQVPARALPRSVSLSYYDATRDYQTGQMRASAAVGGGVAEEVDLAAVLTGDDAKSLAEMAVARRWAQRDRLTVRLGPARADIVPGTLLRLPDGAEWRVRQVTLEAFVVEVLLEPLWRAVPSVPSDPGRPVPAPDLLVGPTSLALFELPYLGGGRTDVPLVHVAACQPTGGWRPVGLEVSVGGQSRLIGSATAESVMGRALTVLGTGPTSIFDQRNSVDVELLDAAHWLESRDDDALVNGANLAVLGTELVQFGSAVAIAPGRYRLSRLLRGRRGTEFAVPAHVAGESFALVDPSQLTPIEMPVEALGSQVSMRATGMADSDALPVEINVGGEALRPPSPVHLRAQRNADGGLRVTWFRRSRSGWAWLDGVDAPLGESLEHYQVKLQGTVGEVAVDVTRPEATFVPEQMALAGNGAATVAVVQVGDFALSRPSSITVDIEEQ